MFRSHADHAGIPLQTECTYTHHMLWCRITTL